MDRDTTADQHCELDFVVPLQNIAIKRVWLVNHSNLDQDRKNVQQSTENVTLSLIFCQDENLPM